MQHWTDYWQSTDALNSFAEGEQGKGYQAEVAQFWESQFTLIPSEGTVVDLGTGNGAVAVLAQQFSQENSRNWKVIGLDAADIAPGKLNVKDKATKQSLSDIEFITKTPIEKAPFEKESVDTFISQFAFEYSDIKKSITHCFDCLKPGGFISIIAHHPESHISQDSLVGETVLESILIESPVFMQTDFLLDIAQQQLQAGQMHNWGNNPYRQTITATLHWIFDQLTRQYSSNKQEEYWCKSTINHVTNILKQIGRVQPNQLRTQLKQMYHNLNSHRLRLKDQNEACLNNDKLSILEQFCSKQKTTLIKQDIKIEDQLFGTHIFIKK